jgi:tRNA1(Val) A37 N6-methylase TrmN6
MDRIEVEETFEILDKLGMKIFQIKDGFRFGIDSILIPYFANFEDKQEIVEIGTGSGIISMQLTHRYPHLSITAVEIQEEVARVAKKNIEYNKLNDRINIVNEDIKNYKPKCKVDAVITNPPYMKVKDGKVSENKIKAVSRHEVGLDLSGLLRESSRILKSGGSLTLIYRTDRFYEFMSLIGEYGFYPKRLRFIYSKKGLDSILFMVEVIKKKNIKLSVLDPLYIYDEKGLYTDEVKSYY